LFNVIINNADGIVVADSQSIVVFVNPAAEQIFDRKAQSFIGKPFLFPVHAGETHEHEFVRPDGRQSSIEMRVVDTSWEGVQGACLISIRDISMRKQAERALRESEERYALAIRGAQEGLWDWDLKNNQLYFSPEWKSMLGYDDAELDNTPDQWYALIHEDERDAVRTEIEKHLKGETPSFQHEFQMRTKDGTYRWVLCRATAIRGDDNKPFRFTGSQIDFTARKNAEREMKQALNDLQFALASEKVLMEELDRKNHELIELSITDGLTSLYNHRFIQERFDFEFRRVKRYGGNLSCMLIDIDHFKAVNDTYGHQFGDVVLRGLATLIRRNSRDVDICGRYGGEEFMILTNQNVENALKHASKLHSCVETTEFTYNGQTIHITVSIGIADYRDDVLTKQQLIERSDTAMYEAKEDGRNLIRIWKEREDESQYPLDKYGIADLKKKFQHLSTQMRAIYMESTNALVKAVEAKDPHTQRHSDNVAAYSVKLARQLKVPESEIEVIKYAALLHDVGKIGVTQEILIKTDPLTDGEYELLKKHPIIGVNILKDVKFLEKELPIILHHHERFDGAGYPYGLKGREIPLGARILAVVDAFEAMTAGRTYREGYPKAQAMTELIKGKNTQFAPDVVDAFIDVLKQEGNA
jgi:diguanylate cyclase (GGDEF)-like protein/PAS domain S-box-containing protein/putative nucleotidyltransferase with HDIG domain